MDKSVCPKGLLSGWNVPWFVGKDWVYNTVKGTLRMLSQHLPETLLKNAWCAEKSAFQKIMTHRLSRFLCGISRAHELGSLIFTKPNPGGTGADNLPLRRKRKISFLASLLFIFSLSGIQNQRFSRTLLSLWTPRAPAV